MVGGRDINRARVLPKELRGEIGIPEENGPKRRRVKTQVTGDVPKQLGCRQGVKEVTKTDGDQGVRTPV